MTRSIRSTLWLTAALIHLAPSDAGAMASLAARVLASRNQVSVGQPFHLTLTVTNEGASDATGVDLVAYLVDGTGAVSWLDGPSTPFPVTISPGVSLTFTWTYAGSAAGTVVFTTTVNGTDSFGGGPIAAGPVFSDPILIQTPAALTAGLATGPPVVNVGQRWMVTVTVTNTGEADATGVDPGTPSVAGTGGAALVDGPSPPPPVVIPGGGAVTFTWTYSGVSAGKADFTVTVTGADGNSGAMLTVGPLVSSTTATTILLTPLLTVLSLRATPGLSPVNGEFTVVMTVSNSGATAATAVFPAGLSPAGTGQVFPVAGPTAPVPVLNPGQSASFTWRWRAVRGGTVVFSGGATAAGMWAAAVAQSNQVVILDGGADLAHLEYYPTPFRTDQAVGGTLKFRRMPAGTHVRIYDVTGELIRDLEADGFGYAEWNARNTAGRKVAGGVYFFAAVSPAGEKRLGKVELVH